MRVLVVDDHQLVADALTKYLLRINSEASVTHTTTFGDALKIARESEGFDLAILDLYLPDLSGLEGLTILRHEFPNVPIVMISGVADLRQILDAFDRGAAGFIPKDLSAAAIVKALELVLAGERYIPSIVVSGSGLIEEGVGRIEKGTWQQGSPLHKLTAREREVLAGLIEGNSNKKIAQIIGVQEGTAAFHLKGVFKKLGVSNRAQAVAVALRLGWG